MKLRKRAVSSTPAMPMTRSLGKRLTSSASWAIASRGLLTTIRMACGDRRTSSWVTPRTMAMLVLTRSSRDMPGLRGTPEVMTQMLEPAVSS